MPRSWSEPGTTLKRLQRVSLVPEVPGDGEVFGVIFSAWFLLFLMLRSWSELGMTLKMLQRVSLVSEVPGDGEPVLTRAVAKDAARTLYTPIRGFC